MDVQKYEHRTRALLLLDKLALLLLRALLCSNLVHMVIFSSQTGTRFLQAGAGLVRSLLVLVLIIILPCAGPATHSHTHMTHPAC
jgi:hypothetical protein